MLILDGSKPMEIGNHLWLPDLVRLAVEGDDQQTARVAAQVAATSAERTPIALHEAIAAHCAGLVAADPILVGAGAQAYERAGAPLLQGHALEDAAVLNARRGDLSAARTAYLPAIVIYTDLDAAWDLRRADARLRPLGVRRGVRGARPRARAGWEALTSTELSIARLIAAGWSNPDIALQLVISRRTVETHISHVMTKLNARSRVEVVRAALHHEPPDGGPSAPGGQRVTEVS
jgi:DNA-binding CsgD family transcriptional regulator